MRGKWELEREKQNSSQPQQFIVYELVVTQFYAGCIYESNVLNKGIFEGTEYKDSKELW